LGDLPRVRREKRYQSESDAESSETQQDRAYDEAASTRRSWLAQATFNYSRPNSNIHSPRSAASFRYRLC
jgi:hypothetical protein